MSSTDVRPVVDWFAPLLPESRAAIFRTICYLFVIADMHLIVRDPIPLSRHAELYRPLLSSGCSRFRRRACRSRSPST